MDYSKCLSLHSIEDWRFLKYILQCTLLKTGSILKIFLYVFLDSLHNYPFIHSFMAYFSSVVRRQSEAYAELNDTWCPWITNSFSKKSLMSHVRVCSTKKNRNSWRYVAIAMLSITGNWCMVMHQRYCVLLFEKQCKKTNKRKGIIYFADFFIFRICLYSECKIWQLKGTFME